MSIHIQNIWGHYLFVPYCQGMQIEADASADYIFTFQNLENLNISWKKIIYSQVTTNNNKRQKLDNKCCTRCAMNITAH